MTKNNQSIIETFPDEPLMAIRERTWFTDMANYKATQVVSEEYTWSKGNTFIKKKFFCAR